MARAYTFDNELALYGPTSSPANLTMDQAKAYCAWLTRKNSENFTVISWFLPLKLIPAFEAVYAFCRWSDDLGDEAGNPEKSLALLKWWQRELHEAFADPTSSKHPILIALTRVATDHHLALDLFDRLINAFVMDQTKTKFATRAEVLDYCHLSANPVGEIVLTLFGSNNKVNLQLSNCICTGLQLTNFWQDVKRDLDIGRIYLPTEDMDRFGVTETDLLNRKATEAIQHLIRNEVDWAESLFNEGQGLPDSIQGSLGEQIRLFLSGGRAILAKIRQGNYQSIEWRPTLNKWDKGRLVTVGIIRFLGQGLMSPFQKRNSGRLPT